MSLGLPSRVFCSDLQNGSAWQFGVSVAKNRRCSRWKFTPQFEMRRRSLEILSCAREVGFQIRIFGKGADELRLFIRNTVDTYGRASLREFSSRGRTSRPHCYVDSAFDDSMASSTKRPVLKELPAETANSLYSKDASSRVIRECGDAADRLVSQAGTPFLAVRCDADSSDKGKEEILWTNKSVTTASGALTEWRSARTRSGQDIVDWGRYHLQVMFVDRSHRARSRLAEGLFERIAAWNGFGLILYGHSCGISAKEGELPSMSYQGEAQRLGVARHVFKAPATTLDRSDLDSYDLIVAMDIEVRDEVLRIAGSQPSNGNDYVNKVRLISEFVSYGTTSLLEDTLLELIQPDLTQALTALEVQVTYMSQYSKWRMMVATITMCCAGLIQFLMDAYPDDLPDYDPID